MLKFRQLEDGSWEGYRAGEDPPKSPPNKVELNELDELELRQYAAEKGIGIPDEITVLDDIRAFLHFETMSIDELRQLAAEKGIALPASITNPNTARSRINEALGGE